MEEWEDFNENNEDDDLNIIFFFFLITASTFLNWRKLSICKDHGFSNPSIFKYSI